MAPQGSRMRLEFLIASRGLFGYRNEFMTDTRGEGVLNSIFYEYQPLKPDIPRRLTGSLIAFEPGESTTYGLYNAQERGVLFVEPTTEVYEGMIVGENSRDDDMDVNITKEKKQTNVRSSTADNFEKLIPPKKLSLEQSLEFCREDECVEVTPTKIRIRKVILDAGERARSKRRGPKG